MTNITAATEDELDELARMPFPRVCGETHRPDCHHRRVMREGVVEYLAAPRTRQAILAALASPEMLPEVQADSILAYLSTVVAPVANPGSVSPLRMTK